MSGSLIASDRKPRPTAVINTTGRSTVFVGNASNSNINASMKVNGNGNGNDNGNGSGNGKVTVVSTTTNTTANSKDGPKIKASPLRYGVKETHGLNTFTPSPTNKESKRNVNSSAFSEKVDYSSLPDLTKRRLTRGHLVPLTLPEDQGLAFIKSRPGPKPAFTDERQARALRNIRINYKHLAVPEHVELMLA